MWIALAAAAWAFLAIAGEVHEGELDAFDKRIVLALRQPNQAHIAIGPHWLTEAMRDITALGGVTVLTLIVIVSVIVLLLHNKRREAWVLAGTVVFAEIASSTFKLLYARARPTFAIYGDLPASNSFPSGHSTLSATVYFLLAVIVARMEPAPKTKTVVFVLAAVLTATIGVSRVFLGVHWPSDVLAGWTLGGALALLATRLWLEGKTRNA